MEDVDPSTCPHLEKSEGGGAGFGHAERSQEYEGSGNIQRHVDRVFERI